MRYIFRLVGVALGTFCVLAHSSVTASILARCSALLGALLQDIAKTARDSHN